MGDASITNRHHKSLFIILAILCTLIIIMIITIIIFNLQSASNSDQTDQEIAESMLPEELKNDNLSPLDQVTKETSLMLNNPNYSHDDILNYYDTSIDDAMANNDASLAVRIIIQKMNFISVIEKDCNKAEKNVDSLDLSIYPTEEKDYLISYIASVADACGNQEMQNKWQALYEGLGE